MVHIKECEEGAETSEDETTEEEDEEEKPPDLPAAPIMSSAPEPSAPDEAAAGPSAESDTSGNVSPVLRVGINKQYILCLLREYGHSVELNRSSQEANVPINVEVLSEPASERPPNGNGDPQFERSISARYTPGRPMEDNRCTDPIACLFFTERSSKTTEEFGDKDEGNKSQSDESPKEKSNGMGEKVKLTTTAAGTEMGIPSSPDLSEYELSDVSDFQVPTNYESLQTGLNQEHTPSALKDCPSAKDVSQTSEKDAVDPDMTAEHKELSEASDEGEATALPLSSVVKDCWEEWSDDDSLFNLVSDTPAPFTSSGVSERIPSPPIPETERRRIRKENRRRVRQHAAKPVTRHIYVPTEKIGRIVGKGGRRIRELEKESGANIKVQQKKSAKPATQITLTGTEEQISKADEEICVIIRNFKPAKSGEPTTASVSSAEETELKRLLLSIKNQVLDSERRSRKPPD